MPLRSLTRRTFLRSTALAAATTALPSAAARALAGPAPAPRSDETPDVALHWLEGTPAGVPTGVVWGVPWPRGRHAADTTFAVATEDGDPVPVQTWPLATWPDGTLKWTGHALPADAGRVERLRVEPGDPATPETAVTVSEERDSVVVDTGPLTCTIATAGDVLLRSLVRDGRETARNVELVCLHQDAPDEPEKSPTRTEQVAEIDEVVVEQRGPVRAVVKVIGHYVGPRPRGGERERPERPERDDRRRGRLRGGRRWLPFTVRLHFAAGAEALRVVHHFFFDGDAERDFIKGLGLRVAVPMADALHDRHIRFVGDDGGVWGEAVRVVSGLRRDPGDAVTDAQFRGVATPPLEEWAAPVRDGIDDVPVWNDYRLVQDDAASFTVAKRTGAHSSWLGHAGHGRRASGLGYVGGISGGLAFGLRDFWQRHPTQLDVRDAGTDEATATVWFWSPAAAAMDLRHYDDERHDLGLMYEEPGRGLEDVVATPEGVARSNEVTLWGLPATPSRERLVTLADAVVAPPLLVADPEHYHSVGVFGHWAPVDRSTPILATQEDDLDRRIAFYRGQVEQRRWYGFWHYGDFMHDYDHTRHTWRYDVGGFAWANGELGPDQFLWYQFLRTGRADVFRMAEAMSLHIAEADVHHIGFFAGLGSRHNVIHWGDGAKEARISASNLKRFIYYLTADERVGDYLDLTLQVDETVLRVPPFREVIPPPESAPVWLRIGPDWIALASNWLTAWERTGDTAYRDRIVRGLEDIGAMPYGLFSGLSGAVAFDPADYSLTFEGRELSGSYHLSMLFGGDQVFYELIDLVDVPAFEEKFIEFCIAYTGTPEERIAFYGRNFNPGGFDEFYAGMTAYAGERLGDDSYKVRAWEIFDPGERLLGPVEEVGPPDVLEPVNEANTTTNDLGQEGLTYVSLLALAGDVAP